MLTAQRGYSEYGWNVGFLEVRLLGLSLSPNYAGAAHGHQLLEYAPMLRPIPFGMGSMSQPVSHIGAPPPSSSHTVTNPQNLFRGMLVFIERDRRSLGMRPVTPWCEITTVLQKFFVTTAT